MVARFFAIIIIIILFFCCQSGEDVVEKIQYTPIVIREIPLVDISDDITELELNQKIRTWAIDIIDYVEDMIIQIKNRVPYFETKSKNIDIED